MTFLRRPIGWIVPVAIFLAIAGAAVITSIVTTRASERSLDAHTQLFTDQLAARLQTCVETRVEMVVAMRREWDAGGLRDSVSFAQRATSLIASFPGYQAINRLDEHGIVVDVHPLESNRLVFGRNLAEHPPTRHVLVDASRTNVPQLSGPIDLIQGGRGFAFYIPLRDVQGGLAGYFNGAFRNDVLVRSCLSGAELPDHLLAVRDGDLPVFGAIEPDEKGPRVREASFPVRNRTWRVVLAPSEKLVRERLAPGRVLVGSGLAFALLVAGISGGYLSYRQRTSEAMRKSREEVRRLAKLVDASRDFIGMGDLEGHLLYLNRAARELLGHEAAPMGVYRTVDLVAPEDAEAAARHFRVAAKQGFARAEFRVRHRQSGALTPLEFQTFVVDARPDGKPLLATVGRDLRERQKLEHDLQQAQKMEALGRLAGGVAHDFNNLLTVILNGAQFAIDTQQGEMRTKILRDVVDAAQRAAGLTRQLMALGRGRNTGVGPVDLGAIVTSMRPLFARLLRADIQLELRTPETPAMLHGNRVQLEQIVVNLVMNASDAMPSGGKLEVEVAAKGEEVLLSVSDTGIGMSPEVAGRIFEPFFTTKPPGAGTGLGLATVYAHVQRLNGRIDVHSSPGHGSRFVLHFPATGTAGLRAPGEVTPTTVVRTAERAPGLRVLLAEDDNLVRSAITRSLRAAGIETVEAENGEAAIRLLSDGAAGRVDVVLSDVVMPKMGGAGLLHWVRGHRPELPVVLISGHTGDELAGIDVQAQGVRVIEKPFDPAKLVQLLRECVGQKA